MRLYNRRLASIARARKRRGTWGRHNDAHRFLFGGFTFARSSMTPVVKALVGWALLELREGWAGLRPASSREQAPKRVEWLPDPQTEKESAEEAPKAVVR